MINCPHTNAVVNTLGLLQKRLGRIRVAVRRAHRERWQADYDSGTKVGNAHAVRATASAHSQLSVVPVSTSHGFSSETK
jgi:hypothetical protein